MLIAVAYGVVGLGAGAGGASCAHGATPNRNLTVCVLEPPFAYTPASTFHGGVIEVVCEIRVCHAECPVCMLEPLSAHPELPHRSATDCMLEPPLAHTLASGVHDDVVLLVC